MLLLAPAMQSAVGQTSPSARASSSRMTSTAQRYWRRLRRSRPSRLRWWAGMRRSSTCSRGRCPTRVMALRISTTTETREMSMAAGTTQSCATISNSSLQSVTNRMAVAILLSSLAVTGCVNGRDWVAGTRRVQRQKRCAVSSWAQRVMQCCSTPELGACAHNPFVCFCVLSSLYATAV